MALWAAGLVLLFAAGFALSKSTLRQTKNANGAWTIRPVEQRLRRLYRLVLNAAGVYYYLSLPLVLVVVIVTAGAAVYVCLVLGWIPVKLLLFLGFGALLTIWAMLKSLFLRARQEDPGRALQRHEAAGLWDLAEEVAARLETRPIDEIRITPGTDLAVYERGSWREKLHNKAKRILILGTGVLPGFMQDDFRCVLAHEYGHFAHRDTAGGDIALRVQNDMLKFYRAMVEAGQASRINVAFHFLRFYHFVFRRISAGATRLQEIMADRVAARCYGAPAFESGLRHVVHRGIAFGSPADREIGEALHANRPLQNLYEDSAPHPASLQEEVEKALARPTTEDDTHPSPRDRFRLVADLAALPHEPRPGEVWDLFQDKDAIVQEMMAEVESGLAEHRNHLG